MTTAEGNGLEFVPGQPSIFTMVEMIKKGVKPHQAPPTSDSPARSSSRMNPQFTLGVDASALLIEAINNIESFRDQITPLRHLEKELFEIL